ILYSTYLGGSLNETARGIAVDSTGSVYITGQTYSTNFPSTAGAYQLNNAGSADAFVVKLDPSGGSLNYATYIGASGNEMALAIALDSSGAAYVAGYTDSTGFPTTASAARRTHSGGIYDGWIAKLSASGNSLAYSTLLGGSGIDVINAITVDS